MVLVMAASPAVAAPERVTADVTHTRTLGVQDHDAFEVVVQPEQVRSISFSAQGIVDFYVVTSSEYAKYTDPNSTGFFAIDSRENSRDFSQTVEATGRIYIIDNADFSVSGASPTGPVTYTVTVGGPSLVEQLFVRSPCFGWIAIVIALIAGTSYWLYSPPKAFRETSKQLRAMLGGR